MPSVSKGNDPARTVAWVQRTVATAPDSLNVHGTLQVGPVQFEIAGPRTARSLTFRSEHPLN